MNEKRIAAGEEAYRNPRNTASGSLKLQDSSETAQRPLECFFYALAGDLAYATHWEGLTKARSWGFTIPESMQQVSTLEEMLSYINNWGEQREDLPFEIDGVVIKVNDIMFKNN